MIDILFGLHIGGWKATAQFVFWTVALFALLLFWYRRK